MKVLESQMYFSTQTSRTMFSTKPLNEKNIRNHSHAKDEDEILLMPGSHFKVINEVSPSSNLRIVQLQQVHPPQIFITVTFTNGRRRRRTEI